MINLLIRSVIFLLVVSTSLSAESYNEQFWQSSSVINQQDSGSSDLLSDQHELPVNDRILSLLSLSKENPSEARNILPKIQEISENFNRAERYLMAIIDALLIDDDTQIPQSVAGLEAALALEDKMAKSQLFSPEFSQIHLVLAKQYAALEQYKKAYQQKELYLDKYQDYRKQLRQQRLAKLNKKYETDLKLKENELLKSEHEIKALQLKENAKKTLIEHRNMIILVVTAIIFLLLLIRQYRVRSILHSLSKTDSLTGLYNRRTLFERGEHFVETCMQEHSTLSVIMLDIDHFKQVNDRFGHHVGDKVIGKVAALGRETIRARDVFARIGGEEFAVVLPTTELDEAKAIAERFREKVEQAVLAEIDHRITISAGVANIAATKNDFDDLLHAADQAMYQAKQSGRNQVCCYKSAES